jgi:hypothetical protein
MQTEFNLSQKIAFLHHRVNKRIKTKGNLSELIQS